MDSWLSRTEALVGKDALEKIRAARVVVFGAGGVGGYVIESLARMGVGAIEVVDGDTVDETNINRQIIALRSTLGMRKVDAIEKRIKDINPSCSVTSRFCFFLPENSSQFDFSKYDYVVDAVDTVAAKLEIIARSKDARVPVISCMGAGNKMDPSLLRVADISQTSVCPLARVMRRELKARGIEGVKVLYSTEKPAKAFGQGARAPASAPFVPAAAGLLIGAEVARGIMEGGDTRGD